MAQPGTGVARAGNALPFPEDKAGLRPSLSLCSLPSSRPRGRGQSSLLGDRGVSGGPATNLFSEVEKERERSGGGKSISSLAAVSWDTLQAFYVIGLQSFSRMVVTVTEVFSHLSHSAKIKLFLLSFTNKESVPPKEGLQ